MPHLTDSLGRKRRKIRERSSPIRKYSKKEFVARYRLSKKVVVLLAKDYAKQSRFKGSTRGGGLSHIDRLCLVLRYFATGSFYSPTGDGQNVSIALVCRSVQDVTDFFYRNRSKYIIWPASFSEKMLLALKVYRVPDKRTKEEQRTPFVFGLVDGTHIPIKTPTDNEAAYVCRKGYHSINTTVISDYDRHILYVDPRWPGSVNDAYALHSSPVGDELASEEWGNFMLLGDKGYGLKKNLFTPFRTENPTPPQDAFNKWHKRTRVRVEQTIGVLKQRWRILDSSGGHIRHEPARAAKIIVTCSCLHNIALNHGIRVVNHPADPWIPVRPPLRQPLQRTREQESDRIKSFRDNYVRTHFANR